MRMLSVILGAAAIVTAHWVPGWYYLLPAGVLMGLGLCCGYWYGYVEGLIDRFKAQGVLEAEMERRKQQ